MLLVITIIGVLAAISLPKINLSRIRSKSAIQTLGTTMLALQRDAISRQHNVVLIIDNTTNSLRVLYDSTNDVTINNNERTRSVPLGEEIVFGRPPACEPRLHGVRRDCHSRIVPASRRLCCTATAAPRIRRLYLSTRRQWRSSPVTRATARKWCGPRTGRVAALERTSLVRGSNTSRGRIMISVDRRGDSLGVTNQPMAG
jgi:type II secretory pathway pseudopilin PulG